MADVAEDVAVDIDTEVEEAPKSNDGEEEPIDLTVELAKEKEARRQLTARALRAEKELKKLRDIPPEPPITSDPQLPDELKLIARGLSDEAIEKAKIIAKGKGVSLTEAIKDPDFLIIQRDLDEKEKREKAKLGASKGSGESEDDILIKPEMTREEHQAAFKKLMG